MDRRRFFMKDFKLVTEQVDLLKSRGMLFEDEQDAICKLLSDNYYNIINGYKDLFLDTTNNQEVFKTGTTFNEIYALYEFDNQLKNIFLEYILKIENILRTQVAYHFSSFHGNDNYLKIKEMYNVDILNWKIDNEKSPVFNYHLSKILEEINIIDRLKNID